MVGVGGGSWWGRAGAGGGVGSKGLCRGPIWEWGRGDRPYCQGKPHGHQGSWLNAGG